MAAAQTNVSLTKFGGRTNEGWNDFESLLTSIEVAHIGAARRIGCLKLHLTGQTLQFFHTMTEATKADLDLTLAASGKKLCNPNLTALHMINLQNMRFNSKTETPDVFLVKLQNLARLALSDPDKNTGESDDEFKKRLDFATLERSNLVERLFMRALPKLNV